MARILTNREVGIFYYNLTFIGCKLVYTLFICLSIDLPIIAKKENNRRDAEQRCSLNIVMRFPRERIS